MYSLTNLYNRIINRDPYIKRHQLQERYSYEVLNEQEPLLTAPETYPFTEESDRVAGEWDMLQRSLFERRIEGSGRGEYSIAALLISKFDPNKYNEFLALGVDSPGSTGTINAAKYIDEIEMVQGGSVAYDVVYPSTNFKYEVKELGSSKSEVRTGTEGARAAKDLLIKIHSNINTLYDKYKILDPASKNMVNQFKTPGGLTIGKIIETAQAYFSVRTGELAIGSVFSKEKKIKPAKRPKLTDIEPSETSEESVSTPKLSLLPDLVFELVMDPKIEEVIPATAERIKEIYNTNDFNARYIDAYVRNYLGADKQEQDPKIKLSDFILYCSLSIFRNDTAFKNEVQNYFIPGTAQHRKALKDTLPVTGIFTVEESSFTYTGASNLEKGIRVTRISLGRFKLGQIQPDEEQI